MKVCNEIWEAGWSKKLCLTWWLWRGQQKQSHHSKELPWTFRAWAQLDQSPFFPGSMASDCDNDQTVALLCNIIETFPHENGSTHNSQLPGQMSYSGANLSFLPWFTYLEKPSQRFNFGEGSREAKPFITEISSNSTPVWQTAQTGIRPMDWRRGRKAGRRECLHWPICGSRVSVW